MIKSFRHACIVVSDLEKSLEFYRDVIGLKVDKVLTVRGRYPEVLLKRKGAQLTYVKMRGPNQPKESPPVFELHHWERPRISPRRGYGHISFTVDDLNRDCGRLRALGVKFLSKPVTSPDGKTKLCFGYDPEGNLIEFVEDLDT
jgi:lactoylglutathione lyase